MAYNSEPASEHCNSLYTYSRYPVAKMSKQLEIEPSRIPNAEYDEEKRQRDIVEMENSLPSNQALENGADGDKDGDGDGDVPKSTLPFSKARCIALAATVTGASFLNVGKLTFFAVPRCALSLTKN